jgi:SPP1 gp7 family putative phage head morphogenesis protein
VYSYRAEFGNLYGKSDLEAAHRAWFIKDQSYMFLGRALERFGVPPVFAHYDARALGPDTQEALKNAMQNWRNGMTGLFPRGEKKESLEFWTPELANQTGEAFDRAIQMFDGAIARAILMPGLLGMTNDSDVGSNARSNNHLDVFFMIIGYIRNEVANTIVNDQIVKQLVDLNFMVDQYPRFKFLPLEGDTAAELIRLWGELTGQRVVRTTPADERHIRNATKFPDYTTAQKSVAELPPPGNPDDPDAPPGSTSSPYGPPDPVELEAARAKNAPKPGDEPGGAGKPGAGKPPGKFSLQPSALADRRALTAYERKVDFARIEETQNGMAAAYAERLRKAISVSLDMLMNEIRSTFNGELSFANYPRLPGVDKWQEVVGALFNEAFDSGRESIRSEVPKAFAEAAIPAADYAKALEYLRTKAFWVTGVTHDRILNEVREALLQSISTGEPIDDVMWRIRKIFEPYVAATASAPGVLLEPSRLETIVRTNLNDVYNMGRIQQAREAGDFLDGFQYSAILDSRTTEVCRRLDGRVFMADDPRVDRLRPPRHHNCRSVMVPIIVGEVIDENDKITDTQAREADELSGDKF